MRDKFRIYKSRHVLSTDDWPVVFYNKINITFHVRNPILSAISITVSMESNDIAFTQYVIVDFVKLFATVPFSWS